LTGPGGVGKTRLALELVHSVADRFDAGGAFTSLAEVPRADDVEQAVLTAIARTVGAREQAGQSLSESLIDHLEDKHLLLVLDNFEHVVAAAPAVLLLLGSCEELTVVVTSREALRVPGEHEYPLAPLALPDLAQPAEPERLRQNEAVALFVERACGVLPSFALSDVNATAVAEICVRLDGLPLALELAAARVKMLSPPTMLKRLKQRLPMLTGGARAAPEHQRTLAATIAWGYELLNEEEQVTFARISVFRGGFPLEAAEEVCGAKIDVVFSLADKSLLRQADDRFVMLETIRDYAQDRLETSPDATETRRRHAEWVLTVLQQAEPHLYGRDQGVWLQRLDRENDNLRTALDLSRTLSDRGLELRLLAACWHLWYLRARYTEGESRIESALPGADAVDPALHRDLLNALFTFHRYQGRIEQASTVAAQSLQLRHTLPKSVGLLRSLINGALAAGDAADRATAENLTHECVALAARLDQPWCHAIAMTNLADVELRQHRFEQAAAHAAEASRLLDEIGDAHLHATCLANLAAAELELTNTATAVGHLKQALRQIGGEALPDAYFYCIDGLAAAEARRGHAYAAARLIGVADAITARTNFAVQGFEQTRRERTLAMLADHLDAAEIAQARADGAALPITEAVALALQTAG
jgi:predicted ATPase